MAQLITRDVRKIDLADGLTRETGLRLLALVDESAHVYGAEVYNGGESVSLTGATVTGYFVRADGTTVEVAGAASGSTATVTLNEYCYAVQGRFTLAIKVIKSSVTMTVRLLEGYVYPAVSGRYVELGTASPSIDDVVELIDGKLSAPAQEGLNGHVLTVDDDGATHWEDVQLSVSAGSVDITRADGTTGVYRLRTGEAGVTGYLTITLEG